MASAIKSESVTEKNNHTNEINPFDVLCGQWGESNSSDGNVTYFGIVERNLSRYADASSVERKAIALKVVEEVINKGGRFLKKDRKSNRCYLADNRAVLRKVSEDLEPKIYIVDGINADDVLCGQGGESNNHEGNVQYLTCVGRNRPDYATASPTKKTAIALEVMKEVVDMGGRFLKKDKKANRWYLASDRAVRNKVTQALRDKSTSPEARANKRERYSKADSKKRTKIVDLDHCC
jgi:hypothetical protein